MTFGFEVSDTLEALNAGLFVSPGFGTHPERVLDSYELMFVTQGRLDMFEENRSFPLLCNQTLLLCPGLRHGGLLPYAADVNFYWVHFRARSPGGSHRWVSVPKMASIHNPDALTELFCRFISDQESGILDPLSAAHLVSLMLCAIREDAGQARRPAADASAFETGALADRVQGYIDVHCRKPISTSDIAAALGYNPDYMERVFRARYRLSILDALHQRRIGMARFLLHSEAGKNINEIAFQCGYTDPGYFRRMFKRIAGMTPREFRTLYARTHINTH
ncbi:MAG TPA: AraC family transcriptional regulator [Spirochaetia bacterium]|nr:AraC family transcriptional regulator [Spirochaetia bacterium]